MGKVRSTGLDDATATMVIVSKYERHTVHRASAILSAGRQDASTEPMSMETWARLASEARKVTSRNQISTLDLIDDGRGDRR